MMLYLLSSTIRNYMSDYKCPKALTYLIQIQENLKECLILLECIKSYIIMIKKQIIQILTISEFDNTNVKIFVTNKTDEDMYNNLVERFYNTINVHELQIIEDPIDVASTVRSDILEQGEDTLTFLGNYIDQMLKLN